MPDWNPYTHQFCHSCPHYRSEGEYIFELEENPKLRRCRYLPQCYRVARIASSGEQTKLGGV